MTQSEKLMQGIKFGTFRVDIEGFETFVDNLMQKFAEAKEELAMFGLEKFNSTKEKKAWMENMGIDCSRGSGKEVYENPANLAAHPAELGALAKVQKLETLRRKIAGFRAQLIEEQDGNL